MNTRHVLFCLIAFVSVTTITMVLMSRNMANIQVKAYNFVRVGSKASHFVSREYNPSTITNNNPQTTESRNPESKLTQENKTRVEAKKTPKKPETTNRPLRCKDCFQTNFRHLTPVPEVCTGTGSSKPEMLMLITTTLDGLPRRQAIRDTWASVTERNTGRVRHLFLLGTDKEGRVSEEVKAEGLRYKDMMVSDFVDAYSNLTYKTLAGLHYLVEHCRDAQYFLKTDQDMYIFVDKLLNLAKNNHNSLQTSLGGRCHQSGKPWRNPKTKYYASIRSYPQASYPGFCSGTGYVGSFNVAQKIVETSPNVPFFHLEDVYLALVLRTIGYKLTMYGGFVEGSDVCAKRSAKHTITIHEVSPTKIREFWAKKCGI
ncbi:hypothetical protein ACOMHN_006750 [Nucella lapillus]